MGYTVRKDPLADTVRALDVIVPLYAPKVSLDHLTKAFAIAQKWREDKRRRDLPFLGGRVGITQLESVDGKTTRAAVTFNSQLNESHPLFATPDKILELLSELLGKFGEELEITEFVPAYVYYGDRVWTMSYTED